MPNPDDDKDGKYALRRIPGRFYVSSRFPEGGPDGGLAEPRICRFAYQVMDEDGDVEFESDEGWEVVLRETPTRQQLKALFFEDSRGVQYLSFQRFNADGVRLKRDSFVLSGPEVRSLGSYLALIRSQALDLAEQEEGVRFLRDGVDALLDDEASRLEIFNRYRDVLARSFEADVEAPEIVAFARRRHQLTIFDLLLHDADAFEARREELKNAGRRSNPEDVWQDFFEANPWVFGTGLTPQFLHAWNPEKLEQAVVGPSILGEGKRPDAFMRTAGALSAVVFVEIKTHSTPLLDPSAYRSGAWRVDEEVSGGVAQCQTTVDEFTAQAERELDLVDADGFKTGESAFVCRPRSLLVVGSLEEFIKNGQPHVGMFESFERFRRSLRDPEIVTFDELYARAAMSLALADSETQDGFENGPESDIDEHPFESGSPDSGEEPF